MAFLEVRGNRKVRFYLRLEFHRLAALIHSVATLSFEFSFFGVRRRTVFPFEIRSALRNLEFASRSSDAVGSENRPGEYDELFSADRRTEGVVRGAKVDGKKEIRIGAGQRGSIELYKK